MITQQMKDNENAPLTDFDKTVFNALNELKNEVLKQKPFYTPETITMYRWACRAYHELRGTDEVKIQAQKHPLSGVAVAMEIYQGAVRAIGAVMLCEINAQGYAVIPKIPDGMLTEEQIKAYEACKAERKARGINRYEDTKDQII